MKKLFIFWLWFFICSVHAQKEGQALIDSLQAALPKMNDDTLKVNALRQLSFAYHNINPEQGIVYGQKTLALAKKINWSDGVANAYKNIGLNYSTLSDFPSALNYYALGLKASKNEKIKSDLLNNIGLTYSYQSQYSKALSYYFQSLKIKEKLHYAQGIAPTYYNIAALYYALGDTQKAIFYNQKALQANKKINNQQGLSRILLTLGNIYYDEHQFEAAMKCYQSGLKITEKLGDKTAQAIYLASIANVFYEQKKYALAIEFCKNATAITNQGTPDESVISLCSSILGSVYLEMAKEKNNQPELLKKARAHFIYSVDLNKKINHQKALFEDYDRLYQIDQLQGNYKSALEFYQLSKAYKDSIFSAENKETIKNLEDKRAIELRDNQIKINKLELESKEKQKNYLMLGILLLGIIGALLWFQNHQRKKANRKLANLNLKLAYSNKIKAKLLSILNHDLRSPVNSFIHFIQFQKQSPELLTPESKERIENETLTSAKNLLQTMEDLLLWTKDQMDNFETQPKTFYISALFKDIKTYFASESHIEMQFLDSANVQIHTDPNYLKTILRNLTANAVKALQQTQNPIIIWKAEQDEKGIRLSISDNGLGADEEQFKALFEETEISGVQNGLGLHLVRDLAKAIEAEIVLKSQIGQGTTIEIRI
ncbi:MAG: tetratricopeptide repeat-containing sensor histidine kinase [Bacteroidetes bacterium]|nr:tetratricopeptide repeat-containing sensor histidine kinase [Bacteroidota bacterium]